MCNIPGPLLVDAQVTNGRLGVATSAGELARVVEVVHKLLQHCLDVQLLPQFLLELEVPHPIEPKTYINSSIPLNWHF